MEKNSLRIIERMPKRIFGVTSRDFSGEMPRESILKSFEEFLGKYLRTIFLE